MGDAKPQSSDAGRRGLPLAAVWELCRQWDDRYNAELERLRHGD